MRLIWSVTARDAAAVKKFVASRIDDQFVKLRIERNVHRERSAVNVDRFWKGLLVGLLTTQQRSGPSSAVARFFSRDPFPLPYHRCLRSSNVKQLALRTLTEHGGIRRTETLAEQISTNLAYLRSTGWSVVLPQLRALETRSPRADEPRRREQRAADVLASAFVGIGPKQSRNVLQLLGLTQYEIPIDSRITSWLNDFGFPFRLSAQALSDPSYYAVVSSGIQKLCARAGVLPCVLDAAIFSSFDQEEWPENSYF